MIALNIVIAFLLCDAVLSGVQVAVSMLLRHVNPACQTARRHIPRDCNVKGLLFAMWSVSEPRDATAVLAISVCCEQQAAAAPS